MPNVLEPNYLVAMRQFRKHKIVAWRTNLFIIWIDVAGEAKRDWGYPIERGMASGFAHFLISIFATKSESSAKAKIAAGMGKKYAIYSFLTGLMWQQDDSGGEKVRW